MVQDLSNAITDLTDFIDNAEEHKQTQLNQLEEMNNMFIDYELNYRRREAACQTDLSATQYTRSGLVDLANHHFG